MKVYVCEESFRISSLKEIFLFFMTFGNVFTSPLISTSAGIYYKSAAWDHSVSNVINFKYNNVFKFTFYYAKAYFCKLFQLVSLKISSWQCHRIVTWPVKLVIVRCKCKGRLCSLCICALQLHYYVAYIGGHCRWYKRSAQIYIFNKTSITAFVVIINLYIYIYLRNHWIN